MRVEVDGVILFVEKNNDMQVFNVYNILLQYDVA